MNYKALVIAVGLVMLLYFLVILGNLGFTRELWIVLAVVTTLFLLVAIYSAVDKER